MIDETGSIFVEYFKKNSSYEHSNREKRCFQNRMNICLSILDCKLHLKGLSGQWMFYVLYCSSLPQTLCYWGTMRQTFSKATPSLSQDCEWEAELQRLVSASAWWCILCPEPPSSPLQQLSRPGTKAEAWWRRRQPCSILFTTPTLPHTDCTPLKMGFTKVFHVCSYIIVWRGRARSRKRSPQNCIFHGYTFLFHPH